jgi:hypothetical protein
MSFLHIHLVSIAYSYTYIWSGYVIAPHASGPDIRTRYMWRNDISGPDGCGGKTYPDRMNVEESHIRTSWMWRNDICGPDGCGGILARICHSSTPIWSGYVIPPHPSGLDMSFIHMHLVRIMYVEK